MTVSLDVPHQRLNKDPWSKSVQNRCVTDLLLHTFVAVIYIKAFRYIVTVPQDLCNYRFVLGLYGLGVLQIRYCIAVIDRKAFKFTVAVSVDVPHQRHIKQGPLVK